MNLVRVKRRSATRSHLDAMFEHYRLASFAQNTQDFEEIGDYYKNPSELGTSKMKSKVVEECATGVSFILDLAMDKVTKHMVWDMQARPKPLGARYDKQAAAGILTYDGSLSNLPHGFQARVELAGEYIDSYNTWLSGEGYALEVVLDGTEVTIGPYIHMHDLVSELVHLYLPYSKFTDGLVKVNGRPPVVSLFKETLIEVNAKMQSTSKVKA